MATNIFRFCIVLTLALHISFITLNSPPVICCLDLPIFQLSLNAFYIFYGIQFLTLIGLFFLIKPTRLIFPFIIFLSLIIVFTQGGTAYTPLQLLLIQIGCGLYGAIITMSFLTNINWRNANKYST